MIRLSVITNITIVMSLAGGVSVRADTDSNQQYSADERGHWSYQARSKPSIPQFSKPDLQGWIKNPIDAFVLRRLNQSDLSPSGVADRRTLIRRVTFNLIGLPPTLDQVERFLNDNSPDAYEALVDRLLASPQYGEKWGQHWLDVVRFAETEGFEYDRHQPNAWRFRDYVIHSFNHDRPFDQFILEQLAGDELPLDGAAQYEARIAAGFYRLGPVRRNAGNAEVSFSRNEVLTERTNIIGAAFLGLTIGCARCHDHMYDAIRQKDYYQFQTFLSATYSHDIPLVNSKTYAKWKSDNGAITKRVTKIKEQLATAIGDDKLKLEKQLKQLEKQYPDPPPSILSVKNDAKRRTQIHLLDRGDENKPKEALGMRVLGVLLPPGATESPSDLSNPKTKLSRWIVSPTNPLTARVLANRIWHYHFGRGIVATTNDFGVNGAQPSHPELLDFLANRLVENSWRIKQLHRLILTSNTYRQSSRSAIEEHAFAKDPDNRLLWKSNRRRLQAEELRDAMLAISGKLNRKPSGPSVMVPVDQKLIELLYKATQWKVTKDILEHDRRSVYLIAKRNLRLPFMAVFDQPDLQTSCGQRLSSTHAPQALELLNGPFSIRLAAAFAHRLKDEAGEDHTRQIQIAFQLATGRRPNRREHRLALEFLKTEPVSEFALTMFNLNSFLYVD